MLGEWARAIAFPIPEQGEWPRHGDGRYLRPDFVERTPCENPTGPNYNH